MRKNRIPPSEKLIQEIKALDKGNNIQAVFRELIYHKR